MILVRQVIWTSMMRMRMRTDQSKTVFCTNITQIAAGEFHWRFVNVANVAIVEQIVGIMKAACNCHSSDLI